MGIRSKASVSNSLKKDLMSLSTNLRNLQLTIADAAYALKHHVIVNQKDLKMVESGIDELDRLRMQLISLSSVGSRTYHTLTKDESLIQSLRVMKRTVSIDNTKSLSRAYLKSRNSVLTLLKDNIKHYSEEDTDGLDLDLEDIDKALTERVKFLLVSFPLGLVNAYCKFFYDIEEKINIRSRKPIRKTNYQSEIDRDLEVMRGVYNLAEAYKELLLKNLLSIEELIGVIKGMHIAQWQFDIPLIESLSIPSLGVAIGAALAIRELEEKH